MPKADRKGRTKGDARHVRHYEWMLASPAYRALSCEARALLLELYRLYNGENNGHLFMSCRTAAGLLNVGKNVPTKLFGALMAKGFVKIARDSSFNTKTKEARAWTLTEFGVNGELPTKDFMRWRPDAEIQNTVPKSGTHGPRNRDRARLTVPETGTVSPGIRDRKAQNRPSHGPSRRDTDSIPSGVGQEGPINEAAPRVLVDRVARLPGVDNLGQTPEHVVSDMTAGARAEAVDRLERGDLTDSDLIAMVTKQ